MLMVLPVWDITAVALRHSQLICTFYSSVLAPVGAGSFLITCIIQLLFVRFTFSIRMYNRRDEIETCNSFRDVQRSDLKLNGPAEKPWPKKARLGGTEAGEA